MRCRAIRRWFSTTWTPDQACGEDRGAPLMAEIATIPQPRPLPVLGNLPDIDIKAPVQSLMRLAETHGPIYHLTFGDRTITVLGSQELVNEVCDESRFAKK